METPANDRQAANRRTDLWGRSFGNSGNLGADVPHLPESGYVVVAILLLLFVCLMLPLMVMLYFDALALNKKTERTEARIEKLLKDLEKKEKQ